MKTLGRYALTLCATSATLAGCGSQGALSPPAERAALVQLLAPGTSEVQYFSAYNSGTNGTLLEFDYPKSESPIGSISFNGGGECTKGAGTFWTVASNEIAEFKAGGTTPIRALKASASECAVDPATGDLAAPELSGGVIIFHKARGKGKVITPLAEADFDGYDDKSNLFVDGFSRSDAFELVELEKGSRTFETITTSNTVEPLRLLRRCGQRRRRSLQISSRGFADRDAFGCFKHSSRRRFFAISLVCGESQPQIGAPGVVPRTRGRRAPFDELPLKGVRLHLPTQSSIKERIGA